MRIGLLGAVAAAGVAPLVAGERPRRGPRQEPLMHGHVEKGKSPFYAKFQSSLAAILATTQGLSNATEHGSATSTVKSHDGVEDHEAVVEMFSDDKCSTDSLYSRFVLPVSKQCIPTKTGSAKLDCETKQVHTFSDPECTTVEISGNLDQCTNAEGGAFQKVTCIESTKVMLEAEGYQGKHCDKLMMEIALMDTECHRSGEMIDGKVKPASEKFTVEGDMLVHRKWQGVFDCSGEKPTFENKEEIVCDECRTQEGAEISYKFVRCSETMRRKAKSKSGSVTTSWNAVVGMSVLLITTLLMQQ